MVVTVGDVFEVAVVHTFNLSDEQVNVFRFKVTTGGVPTEAEFADDIVEWFANMYAEIGGDMSNDIDPLELRYRDITHDLATVYVPWVGSYGGGTGTADALPPQNAALVLERTGTKNVVGKKYLPTFTEATQVGGVIGATNLGHIDNWCTYLLSGTAFSISGIEWMPYVHSRSLGSDIKVLAAQPRVQMAIQRRRRVGRGS